MRQQNTGHCCRMLTTDTIVLLGKGEKQIQLATLYQLLPLIVPRTQAGHTMIMRRLLRKYDGLLLITYHRHFFVPLAKTEVIDIKASRRDQRVGL
ncbi:hypothetical protein TNCT_310991 [Trichonephila clavata]|uniref:Uncharacterized protein n=1 Tax=Trichonephila clavata TaxID=2740835 RepID=A0A8X6LPQ5_TRICU|nr:hypothetical protein TNCT_310991 [Trichonephila clavata]